MPARSISLPSYTKPVFFCLWTKTKGMWKKVNTSDPKRTSHGRRNFEDETGVGSASGWEKWNKKVGKGAPRHEIGARNFGLLELSQFMLS